MNIHASRFFILPIFLLARDLLITSGLLRLVMFLLWRLADKNTPHTFINSILPHPLSSNFRIFRIRLNLMQ